MGITLNTIATVTTPQTNDLVCDSGWATKLSIVATSLDLAKSSVTAEVRPYASNGGDPNSPTFSDPSAAIPINISNLAAALANYPLVIGPVMQAIESGLQNIATTIIPANKAKLATAIANAAPARANLQSAQDDVLTAKATLLNAQTAARMAGVNGPNDPTYQAARAVCVTAQTDLDAKTAVVTTAQTASKPFADAIALAQAAVDDLSNPPVS